MKRLLCWFGIHAYTPTPQSMSDYIWGYRTWVCSRCSKRDTREARGTSDNVEDVMDRFIGSVTVERPE